MSFLENDIIKLRALEPSDADLLYVWENDPDLWQAGETIVPFSLHALQQYVAGTADIYEAKQLRLMIDAKDNDMLITVGSIDLFDFNPHHRRAGVGILIYSSEHQRKGYALQAIELLSQYVFNVLLINQLYCNIATDNKQSLSLFQKAGFEIAGLKRQWLFRANQWVDEYFLQLLNK